MQYKVEIQRTITTTVTVDANSPELALAAVDDPDFDIPPVEEWTPLDGWEFCVYDAAHDKLLLESS